MRAISELSWRPSGFVEPAPAASLTESLRKWSQKNGDADALYAVAISLGESSEAAKWRAAAFTAASGIRPQLRQTKMEGVGGYSQVSYFPFISATTLARRLATPLQPIGGGKLMTSANVECSPCLHPDIHMHCMVMSGPTISTLKIEFPQTQCL